MTAARLAELIDAHAAALTLLARTYCAHPEDAVQAAFGRLVQRRAEPDDPAAWLFRAVRNAAMRERILAILNLQLLVILRKVSQSR